MPAQNVPPAPVSTSTDTSARPSSSSTAAAMPRATAPLTAFRASGRLIVTTADAVADLGQDRLRHRISSAMYACC